MRAASRFLPFAVAVAITAACGRADDPARGADTDLLGDMVASVPRARLVEELRLDADAEDFSAVSRVYVGPRNQIVVPLPQDANVRIYDASGVRTAMVGRRGSGPGEFQSLGTIGWTADTLWVFDSQQRRVTYVAPAGDVLRTTALPADRMLEDTAGAGVLGAIGMFLPLAVYVDGSMLGEARTWVTRNGRQGISPRSLALLPPAGNASVVTYPPAYEDPRWMLEVEGFGQPVPFTMGPRMSWSADGSRLAALHTAATTEEGGTLVLDLYRWPQPSSLGAGRATLAQHRDGGPGAGEPALMLTYPFRGDPIPRSAVDSALAAFIPAPGRLTEGPPDLPQRFQALARERMPAVYTPVVGIRLGLDDTIWLDFRPTDEGRLSLILDGNGQPIGTVLVPPNVIIRQSSTTHVWATERDDLGLNSVVRYRIEDLD